MFSVKLSSKTVNHWIDSTGSFINLFDLLIDDCAAYWRKVIKKTKHKHIVFLHVTPIHKKANLTWPVVDWNGQKTKMKIAKEYRSDNTGWARHWSQIILLSVYNRATHVVCHFYVTGYLFYSEHNMTWWYKVVWDWKRPHLADNLLGNTSLLLKN